MALEARVAEGEAEAAAARASTSARLDRLEAKVGARGSMGSPVQGIKRDFDDLAREARPVCELYGERARAAQLELKGHTLAHFLFSALT